VVCFSHAGELNVRAAKAARTTKLPGTLMTCRAWRREQVIRAGAPFGAAALPARMRERSCARSSPRPAMAGSPLNSVVGA
jgi:hypothetical protein